MDLGYTLNIYVTENRTEKNKQLFISKSHGLPWIQNALDLKCLGVSRTKNAPDTRCLRFKMPPIASDLKCVGSSRIRNTLYSRCLGLPQIQMPLIQKPTDSSSRGLKIPCTQNPTYCVEYKMSRIQNALD